MKVQYVGSVKVKESVIQSKILKELKLKGCYVVKVQSASKAGVPDIIGCYPLLINSNMVGKTIGAFIGIEVKTPETKTNVSELQQINLDMISKSGGFTRVMWDYKEVENLLKEINETL